METKPFSLRALLTVTTGRLLTQGSGPDDNGISDLLGWMTNDPPCTHQLGRFAEECKPWLLRWYPELGIANGSLRQLDEWIARAAPTCPEEGIRVWLTELRMTQPKLRKEYDVPRIPKDDHDTKNPYDELVEMRGTDEGIILL